MKLSDALKIMRKEFPGRHASLQYAANTYQTGTDEVTVELYVSGFGFVEGKDFEDCLAQMKRLMSKPVPNPETTDVER